MFIPCWLGGTPLCNKHTKIKSSLTQSHVDVHVCTEDVQDTEDQCVFVADL